MDKTMEWTCEVVSFGKRVTQNLKQALALHPSREKFCSYCGGRVQAHHGVFERFEHLDEQENKCIFPIEKFEGESTRKARAKQMDEIFRVCSKAGETIYYGELSAVMNYSAARFLGPVLELIKDWCIANDLPPLYLLAVDKATGLPSYGAEVPAKEVAAKLAQVFAFDWDSIPPYGDACYEDKK